MSTFQQTTLMYSSSFSSAIKLLHEDLRQPIYDVYGLVRYADEIVDTFHDFDKAKLLAQFKIDTYTAIDQGISLNPILHRFQLTFRKYNIGQDLVEAFFNSMEMDLSKQDYDAAAYQNYIYGRDIKADFEGLERMYFPNCDFTNFKPEDKQQIEADIQADFSAALKGIKLLPIKARFGVYVAYKYYYTLYKKIRKTQHDSILHTRIRIPDYGKLFILAKAKIRSQLNLL